MKDLARVGFGGCLASEVIERVVGVLKGLRTGRFVVFVEKVMIR